MLTRSYLITAVSVFLLLSCASDVRGDPISFLYRVDVTSRFGRLTVPFEPTSFDLVATLDDRVTHSFVEPPTVRQVYGTVSFSPIPLPVPNMYPGLSPPEPSSSGAAIEYTRIDFARIPEYEIYGALGSTIGQRTLNGYCCAYEQSATLAGYAKVFTKPVLSARSLARLVGSQGGFDFDIYKNDLAGLDEILSNVVDRRVS